MSKYPNWFKLMVPKEWLLGQNGLTNLVKKQAIVNYANPILGIKWDDAENAEVSEADKNHPLLKYVVPLTKAQL